MFKPFHLKPEHEANILKAFASNKRYVPTKRTIPNKLTVKDLDI